MKKNSIPMSQAIRAILEGNPVISSADAKKQVSKTHTIKSDGAFSVAFYNARKKVAANGNQASTQPVPTTGEYGSDVTILEEDITLSRIFLAVAFVRGMGSVDEARRAVELIEAVQIN